MKKLIIVSIIVFNGFCANVSTGLEGVPQFENRVQAMSWVHDFINDELRLDIALIQSPEKTLRLQNGICEDQATLLMRIFHDQFGDSPEFVRINIDHVYSQNILKASLVEQLFHYKHALVKNNGIMYDPIFNQSPVNSYNYSIETVIDYDTIMAWASLDND